jgi:nitrous oxidase accessory protein NosD
MTARTVCAARLIGLLVVASVCPVRAATLRVGPGHALHLPSEAVAMAHDGDTIAIDAGTYFDCAIISANHLTIAGDGPDTVLTDRACEGKAALVARGNGTTVRNLTLTRIRVADGNGAGIRAEGRDLTIERTRFVNDQIGILAGDGDSTSLIVRDCEFAGNGTDATATADILAGRIALLRIEGSRFDDSKAGPAITSSAAMTALTGNRFVVGTAGRTVPYQAPYVLAVLQGGGLTMQDDQIALMAGTPRLGAILLDADGEFPRAAQALLRRTILASPSGSPTVLLRNWNGSAPVLVDIVLQPGDVAVSSDGVVLHRLKQAAHWTLAWLRAIAGNLHRVAALALRHLFG